MDTLADALLGAILAASGLESGPSVTLVCKRWNRVFYSEPRLWRAYRLAGPPAAAWEALAPEGRERWLAVKCEQLQRVAGLVVEAEFDCTDELLQLQRQPLGRSGSGSTGGSQLAALLALLPPAALTRLALRGPRPLEWQPVPADPVLQAAAAAESAARDAALDALVLPAVTVALTGYPCLASLEIHLGGSAAWGARPWNLQLPPAAVEALGRLRQLHSLSLAWQGDATAQLLHSVLQLAHLTQLELCPGTWTAPAGSLLQLSSLLRLQTLVLSGSSSHLCSGCPPGSTMPSLTRYSLGDCEVPGFPGSEVRSMKMQRDPTDPIAWSAEVVGLESLGGATLQAVLEAQLPAGAAFHSLTLNTSFFTPAEVRGFAAAAALRSLHLIWVHTLGGDRLCDVLTGLLQHASQRLSNLTLTYDPMDTGVIGEPGAPHRRPPPCIVALPGLTSLALSGLWLEELPEGPYLAGLQELDLWSSDFVRLPRTLTAATSLRCLSVGLRHAPEGCPLDCEDIQGVLCQLPALQHLALDAGNGTPRASPSWEQQLREACPQLQVECKSRGWA